MKLPRCLLLLLLCSLCSLWLNSCANVSIPTGGTGGDAITGQPYATAAPAMKINLFGGDLDQFQATYPNGPAVAISGLKTSPAFGMATQTIGDAVRWVGIGKIAKSYFGHESTKTTQAGLTSRTKITSDAATSQAKTAAEAATRQAELQLLAPPAALTP